MRSGGSNLPVALVAALAIIRAARKHILDHARLLRGLCSDAGVHTELDAVADRYQEGPQGPFCTGMGETSSQGPVIFRPFFSLRSKKPWNLIFSMRSKTFGAMRCSRALPCFGLHVTCNLDSMSR